MYFCIKNSQTTVMRIKLSVPGGSVQTKAYDPLMRPTRIKLNNPSQSTLMDYQYTYDAESNITQKATEHGSYDYQYDDLYRLSTVSNPWGMSNEAWTYDALGNRKTDKQRGGSNEWQVNANNQLTKTYTENNSEVTPVWDDNGSLIKHQTTDSAPELNQTYAYDAQNRLIEVRAKDNQSIAHYQYDPFGRRMVKTVKSTETNQENTTYFVYSDDGLIAEANANGAITSEYGWQPVQTGKPWSTDPLFITTTRAGSTEPETFAYQNDHLGTPQKIIDSQGQVVWEAKATAFGETEVDTKMSTSSTIINNLRFPGQYFDVETKTHYNYFRDYNPATGTYRQEDPIGLSGGINVYGYVGGNPVVWSDSEGLQAQPAPALPPAPPSPIIRVISGGRAAANDAVFAARGFALRSLSFVLRSAGLGLSLLLYPSSVGEGSDLGDPRYRNSSEPKLQQEIEKNANQSLQQAIEQEANRREYKNRCSEKPPPGLDQCELAKWKLSKAKDCKDLRAANTNRWWGGVDTKHKPELAQDLNNAIKRAERAVERLCKNPCQ